MFGELVCFGELAGRARLACKLARGGRERERERICGQRDWPQQASASCKEKSNKKLREREEILVRPKLLSQLILAQASFELRLSQSNDEMSTWLDALGLSWLAQTRSELAAHKQQRARHTR